MTIQEQQVIPASRSVTDFEALLGMNFEHVIVLDSHISQLPYLRRQAREYGKKLIIHADLVQGLSHDEAGAQFLCQVIRPTGIISTHAKVVATAKKHRLVGIHRVFLLDSHSLEVSYRIIRSSNPDYVEILPGMMPDILREFATESNKPVLAGGFIRTMEDVSMLLASGAAAVTTSSREIWENC